MEMKSDKAKKGCDKACNLLVFVAVVLVAVSQLLVKKATYMPVSPNYYYDNDTPTPEKTPCHHSSCQNSSQGTSVVTQKSHHNSIFSCEMGYR